MSQAMSAGVKSTEAGICSGCFDARPAVRQISRLPALNQDVEKIYTASYFSDNGDREALARLRAKNPSELTMEEKAILQAANRVGFVSLPGCKSGSNAVLVNINGRDAIVTSGHLVIDNKFGLPKCSAEEKAYYYPNASYYSSADKNNPMLMQKILLEPNPINFENHASYKTKTDKDFLIYYLTENISDKSMPAGTYLAGQNRGSIPFSTQRERTGTAYIIGFDNRYDKEYGRQMSYQACQYEQSTRRLGYFYHTCDTTYGSSGSLMGTIESGEITLQAINSDSSEDHDKPVPKESISWNGSTSSDPILRSIPQN